jgi:hypothetical protein
MLPKQQSPRNTLARESTTAPQEILVTHSLWTRLRATTDRYGRIVVVGIGDADAIGDMVGAGCAVAAASDVAPAARAPTRTMPINQRFMEIASSL